MRFPEFAGEWERTKLGNHITIYSGSSPNLIVDENGEIPYYKVEQLNWCDKYLSDTPYLSKRNKLTLPPNCIVFSKRGAAILTNKVRINPFAINIDTNLMGLSVNDSSSLDYNFLYYFILKAELGKIADTSTIPQINNIHINPLIIPIPSIGEQRKVAKFISLLDRRIAVQSKLIKDLRDLKRFLLEQMFCLPNEHTPKFRLKGKHEDWQKVKLSDIVERVTTRNKTNSCCRVLTIAAQYGLIDQQEFFNKQIASSDLSTYYLLHNGDFAYNKSYSADYPWGAVKRLENYDEGVISSLYICFRPNKAIDSDFLCHYFESSKWYRGISEISGEGARNHGLLNMSVEDYFNTEHRIPSKIEQEMISNVFNCITIKMQSEESVLENYKKQKSYLLNKMFV